MSSVGGSFAPYESYRGLNEREQEFQERGNREEVNDRRGVAVALGAV